MWTPNARDVARLLLGQLADLTQLAGGEEYLDRQAQVQSRPPRAHHMDPQQT